MVILLSIFIITLLLILSSKFVVHVYVSVLYQFTNRCLIAPWKNIIHVRLIAQLLPCQTANFLELFELYFALIQTDYFL